MSLERKDVRAKLDPELHAALVEICALDGVEIAEFIESLLVPVIRKRCCDAIALAKTLERQGFSGREGE
jgi:hypothetical protein